MDFLDTPEKRDRRMVHIPMGRFGEAIEQAKAALFRTSSAGTAFRTEKKADAALLLAVASDESSYITVTCITVDRSSEVD